MTGTVKLNHTRWRHSCPNVINSSSVILENEETHVESLELEVFYENELKAKIHIADTGEVNVEKVGEF